MLAMLLARPIVQSYQEALCCDLLQTIFYLGMITRNKSSEFTVFFGENRHRKNCGGVNFHLLSNFLMRYLYKQFSLWRPDKQVELSLLDLEELNA